MLGTVEANYRFDLSLSANQDLFGLGFLLEITYILELSPSFASPRTDKTFLVRWHK